MIIALDSKTKNLVPWVKALREALPRDTVMVSDEVQHPDEVDIAILWNHSHDFFKRFTNVKLVCSLGAGVDHILSDPLLPSQMPIVRVVSEELSGPMSIYCIGAITYFERKFDEYRIHQKNRIWNQEADPERHLSIGLMGLGQLGGDLAKKLVMLGFNVCGWSKSRKEIEGVTSFIENQLEDFLSMTDVLVCMLPATKQTMSILNKSLFMKMKPGSYLINVGRGQHQVNGDILEALESGILEGAFLDVFPVEPLPPSDPLWSHPKVIVTPHIAVVTKLGAAVPMIAENIARLSRGEALLNLIDRSSGY
jgi:glyoxylate/hydroxypyruvate reductase A